MEYETLTTQDPRYPRRIRERLKDDAPTLYYHGPLKLLDRFNLTVIAADSIAGQALMAMSDSFMTIRQYAMNFIGPWQSVGEMEVFTYVLETKYDPERRRSLTACTARGLRRENWDNFLGDRFGYKGPFTGFAQKPEFYRRAGEEELLWLSVTPPEQLRFERKNIMAMNRVACALANAVYVLYAEKGTKTLSVVRQALKTGVPMFTCQYAEDKTTDVNKDLFALGIPSYSRKTVGKYLESLGATLDAPPPFPPKAPAPPIVREMPVVKPAPRIRQTELL